MKLAEEDFKLIAISIKRYLNGENVILFKNIGFDSVTDGDVGFSYYEHNNYFLGNLKYAGTLNVKATFDGNYNGSYIYISEEGASNETYIPFEK